MPLPRTQGRCSRDSQPFHSICLPFMVYYRGGIPTQVRYTRGRKWYYTLWRQGTQLSATLQDGG